MLTYDKNNSMARQSLSALLSTGLFMLQDVMEETVDVDELYGQKPDGEDTIALVVLKYRHTFDFDDMEKCINRTLFNAEKIEQTISRRKPTLTRWKGFHMAKAGKWYYA